MNQFINIETTVITGFLGAGKTTLLKRILSWEGADARTVVIVNEFGEIGIDGSLIDDDGLKIYELPGGCVCCSLNQDLKRLLDEIVSRINPLRIFLESTGVADPASIIETFQSKEFSTRVHLKNVVTVLEAEMWPERENLGSFFLNQLKGSSIILLNKIDCIPADHVSRILDEIQEEIPGKQVIPAIHCDIGPELLDKHSLKKSEGDFIQPPLLEKSPYVSFTFINPEPLDEVCFRQFTDSLPRDLFRMKGPVRFKDRTVMVNYAGGKSEWKKWHEVAETRLAFVGMNVDGEDTILRLNKCLR